MYEDCLQLFLCFKRLTDIRHLNQEAACSLVKARDVSFTRFVSYSKIMADYCDRYAKY